MVRRRVAALSLGLALLALGCASSPDLPPGPPRPFDFERDTFAFVNELYWTYRFDPETGEIVETFRNDDVQNGQRCVSMARAARQFLYHARFEPGAPRLSARDYRRRVREVLDTDPRADRASRAPVVIPGYPSLRTFSAEHPDAIVPELGARWKSYLQRGNWRMVFPFSPSHQRSTVRALEDSLARGRPPVVHVVNFPGVNVNHTLVVFAVESTPTEVRFDAYDPNESESPLRLVFDRARAQFHYPATPYFPGGPVKLYEVFDGWFL